MKTSRLILLIVVVLGLGALNSAWQSRGVAASHEQYGQGECAECHEDAPGYHSESQWGLTHGRSEPALAERCGACHTKASCDGCHQLAPQTHTQDFREPGRDTDETARHALLARARVSSCLVCHGSPVNDCATCHTLGEVGPWIETGGEELTRWNHLLGEF